MSPCMLSLHLFLGRPRLLLPENSSLSDFAQMWLCSRLKQWPNHFSLLFSRKVSTGFTWASFLMSSFLMWSNLVFPLAHLNILISAEFSLLSSFFFTAQHSEPYVMAGLMIVLKTLSFNYTGIFLSHITPDTSFHFIHPILILLLTSACEPPSLPCLSLSLNHLLYLIIPPPGLEGFTWCGTNTGRNNANRPVSFDAKSQFTMTSFS